MDDSVPSGVYVSSAGDKIADQTHTHTDVSVHTTPRADSLYSRDLTKTSYNGHSDFNISDIYPRQKSPEIDPECRLETTTMSRHISQIFSYRARRIVTLKKKLHLHATSCKILIHKLVPLQIIINHFF